MKQSIVKWLFELNAKQREVLARRFGLLGYEAATLEDVGREIGLTRERVRQIQVEGLRRAGAEYRSAVPRISKHLSERPVSSEAGLFWYMVHVELLSDTALKLYLTDGGRHFLDVEDRIDASASHLAIIILSAQ